MATPGTILFASFCLAPIIPAVPPKIAMIASQIIGSVRAKISLLA